MLPRALCCPQIFLRSEACLRAPAAALGLHGGQCRTGAGHQPRTHGLPASPLQLDKARTKADLKGVTIMEVGWAALAPGRPHVARVHPPCPPGPRLPACPVCPVSLSVSQLYRCDPQGDAEDLPFEADTFDRYVSAGSIGEPLPSLPGAALPQAKLGVQPAQQGLPCNHIPCWRVHGAC